MINHALDRDQLGLQRDGVPQLSLGFGVNICPIFRSQGSKARSRRRRRIELALPGARLEWQESTVFRGMRRMPLKVAR